MIRLVDGSDVGFGGGKGMGRVRDNSRVSGIGNWV